MASQVVKAAVRTNVEFDWRVTNPFGNTSRTAAAGKTTKYVYGTASAALNASKAVTQRVAVPADDSVVVDLNAITDEDGAALNYALVKAIRLHNPGTVEVVAKLARGAGKTLCDALYAVDGSPTYVGLRLPAGGTRLIDCPTAAGMPVGASDTIELVNDDPDADCNIDLSLIGQ